jgi:pimeloyl-ACP methyl ester carboxylesterase
MHRTLLILTALSVALGLITLAPGSEAAQTFLPEPALIDGPVSIGNRSLHVHCAGVGSPVVILEHGYGGNTEEWTAVQAELANQTRVCAYDRASTGQSDTAPDQPHTARDVSRDLKALLHELDIEGPIVIAGFSIGGLFARYHATLLSDQIVRMVLIDSTPPVWPALSLSGLHARARGAMLRDLSGMNDSEPEMVDVLRSGVQVLAAPPAEIPVTMVTAGIKSLQPGLAGDDLDRVLTRLQLEQAVERGASGCRPMPAYPAGLMC